MVRSLLANARSSVILFILFTLSLNLYSQVHEVGIWGGASTYFGDINNSVESLQFARPAGGIFHRLHLNDRFALKTSVNYGMIMGADSISDDVFQNKRNLSFKSNIVDLSSQFEFNFFELDKRSGRNYFTPYLAVGLSLMYYNPKAYYEGEWYALQPLGTEGQQFPEYTENEKYKRVVIGIPISGGIKYNLNKNWTLGVEFSYRQLFTDYVDDVSSTYVTPFILEAGENGDLAVALADRSFEIDSFPLGQEGKQRGNSRDNDAVIFTGISISYRFSNIDCPPPSNWGFK